MQQQERLTALDIFRGVTIAFMVLVNTPGTGSAIFAPLEHAEWHGWTPTDVVFPSFVWIVGVAMTLSLGRKLALGVPKSALFKTACKRAAILFVLGLIGYSFPIPDPATFRILGVLQRIAICYLCATAIYLMTSLRGQIAWIIGLLGSYWLTELTQVRPSEGTRLPRNSGLSTRSPQSPGYSSPRLHRGRSYSPGSTARTITS